MLITTYQVHGDNRAYWVVVTDSAGMRWSSARLDRPQLNSVLRSIEQSHPLARRLPDLLDHM